MRLFLLAAVFIFSLPATAQDEFIVFFTDKGPAPELAQLSGAAQGRRLRHKIAANWHDVRVNTDYLHTLHIHNISVLGYSRWLNAALVKGDLSTIRSFPFVAHIRAVPTVPGGKNTAVATVPLSEKNIVQHNGRELYDRGLTGKGMHIAVFDAGFTGVDKAGAFRRLHEEGRIVFTRDLVGGTSVYQYDQHGTFVLSCMAGHIENEFVGTAVDARYSLFVTENVASESQAEEFNWVMAAELADSLGADIISSSLSYTTFDDPAASYTFKDLDGKTTISARGAAIAASKGILVVNSAGNLRTVVWGKIATPADADSILTVGAVDGAGQVAPFSSPGPSADGRIKPEVCALGYQAALVDQNNVVFSGNGTSFSAPIMSGLVASLWQELPNHSAQDIRQLVLRSSGNFENPDNDCGYGIPNFIKAMSLGGMPVSELLIYPNPTTGGLFVPYGHLSGNVKAFLYNNLGEEVGHLELEGLTPFQNIDVSALLSGSPRRGIYHLVLIGRDRKMHRNVIIDSSEAR